MPDSIARLLVVDDAEPIRGTMSRILSEVGYSVRTAADGFSALRELRSEIPDILLSDLNMPGMSGFELLSVVRRRFPAVHTIAMSGAFSGDEVPSGVAADGFYQKGSSLGCLLRVLSAATPPERPLSKHPPASAPIWIQPDGQDLSGEAYAAIECPECLRTFSLPLGESDRHIREAHCIHCQSLIHLIVIDPGFRGDLGEATPKPANLSQSYS